MTSASSAFPGFDGVQSMPLDTDALIEERVGDLIGRAAARQLWFLFLDELDLQLPLLIPIDGLPFRPDTAQTLEVLERVREVMGDIGASSIVVVFERYGPAALDDRDIEWAKSISTACAECGVELRAELLSHRSGVRWIAADDLL